MDEDIQTVGTFNTEVKRALMLGVYDLGNGEFSLTAFGEEYNRSVSGQLLRDIASGGPLRCNGTRILYGSYNEYVLVAIVGLGTLGSQSSLDEQHGFKENVRIAVSKGAKSLQEVGIQYVDIEDLGCMQSAAEGALLSTFVYSELQNPDSGQLKPIFKQANGDNKQFLKGLILANAQNWTRTFLMELAATLKPDVILAKISKRLDPLGIKVILRDQSWLKTKGMEAFLSVLKESNDCPESKDCPESNDRPVLVELHYNGGTPEMKPIVMIGQYDSRYTVSAQTNEDMIRDGMCGAANVAGAMDALARLKVQLNIIGLLPIYQDMPDDLATKPGHVVSAMDGTLIHIGDTDSIGRMAFCDTLLYSGEHDPSYIIDVTTMCHKARSLIEDYAAAVFTNDDRLWKLINRAGMDSGDRVWRFPLYTHCFRKIDVNLAYDLKNTSKFPDGSSAAPLLQNFVPHNIPWVHVDILNVKGCCRSQPYTVTGMSGRPMRMLVEFICREACINDFEIITDVQEGM